MPVPQGDLSLLENDVAREMLASTHHARLAYVWTDGTPRVVPIWFHWTGDELVFASPANAPKVRALENQREVAVTIDNEDAQPHVLMLRGPVTIDVQDGVVAEYAAAAKRYMGDEGGAQWVAGLDQPGMRMARIALRPTWAAVLDFDKRLPSSIGGVIG